MALVKVTDVTVQNFADLQLCIPPEKRNLPALTAGMQEKRRWALEALHRWGSFGKIAYKGSVPAGLIQYTPLRSYRGVFIYCVYVPERAHWRQGVATKLLVSLIEDMSKPQVWFDHQPALVVLTKPFPGEKAAQYPARSFFLRRGFRTIPDSGTLYYSLTSDAAPDWVREAADSLPEGIWAFGDDEYIRHDDDGGKAVMIVGPARCPYAYSYLLRAEEYIREVAPGITVRWIDASEKPTEVEKRGGFIGCVVNATPIKAFVLDKAGFQREVRQALAIPLSV